MQLFWPLITIYFIFFFSISNGLQPKDIAIIILSEKEGYHVAHADFLQESINQQADILDIKPPKIILSHKLNINGTWTFIPLLEHLANIYTTEKWFFFCTDRTAVRLNKLLELLSRFPPNKELWIGHALYDLKPSIIHHFAARNKRFKYPLVSAGFAITSSLFNSLIKSLSESGKPKDDFSIDAPFEFAAFVERVESTVHLVHVPELCVVSSADCATYPKFFRPCSTPVEESSDNVYFAVKTCAKYHKERVPIIKTTWAKHAKNIGYFSDGVDKNLRDAHVVSNTTSGHCAKTYDILKEADVILNQKGLQWLIICDDDTILSVARLMRLLTCYNANTPVAIGERYGFRRWDNNFGYEYLTGGAGIVLSAPLVRKMIESDACRCPTPTTPDDMFLFGMCLARIGVHATHSEMFHQAQPSDYATSYLAAQDPISFHRFWMMNPESLYDEWFALADSSLSKDKRHIEL